MTIEKLNRLLMHRFPIVDDGGHLSGSGLTGDVTDDDPTKDDDDEDINKLLIADGENEGEEGNEDDIAVAIDDDEPAKATEEDDSKKTPPEKLFTQEEVDRIIDRRLSRIKAQNAEIEQARIQAITAQKQQEDQFTAWKAERFNEAYEHFINEGLTEEGAKRAANRELKRDIEIEQVKYELAQRKESDIRTQKQIAYSEQKADAIAKNPLVANYLKDIDAFSGKGTLVNFDTAMRYIIGDRFVSGELRKSVQENAKQRTLKDVQKRKSVKVEGESLPGDNSKQVVLTANERRLARNFGMTDKEWAIEKLKSTKRK